MSGQDNNVDIHVNRVEIMNCESCGRQLDVSEIATFTPIECPACGHRAHVPGKIDHFLLLYLIGMGGMGGVYCARDLTLGRLVAIKVMLKQLGDDLDFVGTFQREAQAAAQLNHPHVAQIYSFGQEQGQPYIVMELVSGKHLDQMITQEKQLDQSFCMQMAVEIAEGLSAASAIGLLHSDIKPENILFDESGNSKLVDFGLATFVDQQVASGIWGTPYYISPERVRRDRLDLRSDIYSLGATLYHCLTGRPPFEGETPIDVVKARLNTAPVPMEELNPDLHPQVVAIIQRMLEVSPARRYPNYRSLLSDLRKVLDVLPPPTEGLAVSKKVRAVSKRATSRSTTGALGQSGPLNLGETHPKIVVGKADRESVLSEYRSRLGVSPEEAAARKQRQMVTIAVIASVVSIMAIAGVAVGVKYHLDEKRQAQELRALWQAARERSPVVMAEMRAVADTVTSRLDVVRTLVSLVNEDVKAATSAALAKEPPADSGYENLRNLLGEIRRETDRIKNGIKDAVLLNKNISVIERGFEAARTAPEAMASMQRMEQKLKQLRQSDQETVERINAIRRIGREVGSVRVRVAGDKSNLLEAEARGDFKYLDEGGEAPASPGAPSTGSAPESDPAVEDKPEASGTGSTTGDVAQPGPPPAAQPAAVVESPEPVETGQGVIDQARIDRDLQSVARRVKSARQLAKTHQYHEAVELLSPLESSMRTDQGAAALKAAVWRFQLLSQLPSLLAEDLTRRPLRRGWTQDGGRLDIVGATTGDGVKLKSATIPWHRISPEQMLILVKHLASTEGTSFSDKLKADRDLVAAVFCYEQGGERLAAQYAARAVKTFSGARNDVNKLLPGILEQ